MRLMIANFVGAGAALGFAALRTIEDGPYGEIVTAIALAAGCVLFGAGSVCLTLERHLPRPPKNE